MSHPIIKTACVMAGFAVAALAATSAYAGDPVPQEAGTSSSMKVGIDAKTGKLRPLTQAESAKLDAMKPAGQKSLVGQARKNNKGRTLAKGQTLTKDGLIKFVAVNGMTVTDLGDKYMIDTQATIDANGNVVVTHDGELIQNAVEATNE